MIDSFHPHASLLFGERYMNDRFVTLFASPATPQPEGMNELETAYAHGFLRLNDVRSVSDDEAQIEERAQLQALMIAIAAI
jgi:hypothetical protein